MPCQPAPESEAGASSVPKTASQRSLHSHSSSGLSESSDSLTDVSQSVHTKSNLKVCISSLAVVDEYALDTHGYTVFEG